MMTPRCCAALLLALLPTLLPGLAQAGALPGGRLTPQEERGKQIYLRGSSASGRAISAILGATATQIPGTALPCANCHGLDGRGKPEGGVKPSDITWQALTKSYGVTHASGRSHPAYTAPALKRAITEGLDPAGNTLALAMPRYRMSREDLTDLLAYLKRVGKDQDPGLTESGIRVGTTLPTTGPLARMGQAMQGMLTAYFDRINDRGGIYGRRIELRVSESDGTPSATRMAAKRLIEREHVFALVGPFIPGAEKEIASLIETEEVPLVGPVTFFPQDGFPLNRHIFYLLSGLKDQARALVDFAAHTLQIRNPRTAIITPETGHFLDVAKAIEERGKKFGWKSTATVRSYRGHFDAVREASQLGQAGTDVLFLLGAGAEARALVQEAEKRHWTPLIFLPGSLAGKGIFDLPVGFRGKIFLSFPTLPSDRTPAGAMEYAALFEKHHLPARHLAAQLWAYPAARLLVEGLQRAGKDVSREKLITALEGLYEFDTGVTPPITYGPNRRIGALGAYIVSLDLEKKTLIPVSGWIVPTVPE